MESVKPNSPSNSQPLPHQPIPQTSSKPPSKKPRQKKQAASTKRPRPGRAVNNTVTAAQSTSTDPSQQDPPRIVATRGPPLQPYPGVYHIMNPNYPMNPSPFTQHTTGSSYPTSAPVNGASGPGMPGHPHQYYSMHATYPPPPHGYAPYPQYAQQMMMFPPPRPNPAPSVQEAPQASNAPSPVPARATTSSGKRKRKSGADARGKGSTDKDSDHEPPQTVEIVRAQTTPVTTPTAQASISDMKKRTKTQRACDSCRSRKIRCDVLPDSEPQLCQHCKQYGFDCTFVLPITETRFKKKKIDEEASAEKEKEKFAELRGTTSSPQVDSGQGERRIYGPTNPVHLLHSQPTISSRIYENYDQRYHHTWEVSKDGDGFISIQKPSTEEQQISYHKPIDLRLERDVIEKLLNAYFSEIAPLLPIITQAEFVAIQSPSPILLYSMCLVAAARREIPHAIFDSIRFAVSSVIKTDDVLSTASIVNVQALLILSMVGDSHSQFVPNALSALWIRLGTAIRMAQDLGLHRAESVKQNVELRRRLWGACVICDRWTSLAYGQPQMIDVQDCDVRLPSSGDPNDLYMDELVRLSVLLGRVLKTIYSPSGLMFTTDEMLYSLLDDIKAWKSNLPENLKFKGPDTHRTAGLLHILYSCVSMIFWRVFMRISYTCPAHLKFSLTVENWSTLVQITDESIDWLDAHERMYDVWLLVAYAATSCSLVEYHTWARRQDTEAAAKLRKLRDCVRRWEGSISPDHMSTRRKTTEIITLLYEATQGPPVPADTSPVLNPTGGVTAKKLLGGLEYKKDPSRPGGGVFIAHGETRKEEFEGVPEGRIPLRQGEQILTDYGTARHTEPRGGWMASSSMVTITPLSSGGGRSASGNFPNMNPALNHMTSQAVGNVQVLNVLDEPHASNTLEQFQMADVGLLEGIPGAMFDWGQWESFFARFNPDPGASGTNGFQRQLQTQGVRSNAEVLPQHAHASQQQAQQGQR